jgi:hypothetical protein
MPGDTVPVVELPYGGDILSITAGKSFEAGEAEGVLFLARVEQGQVWSLTVSPP